MIPNKSTFPLFCFLLFAAYGQASRDSTRTESFFDWLFQPNEVLEVELKADIDALIEQKMTNEMLPASFRIIRSDGKELHLPVNIRARGRFRRKNCDFPPVKLDFNKDTLEAFGLKKYDEYKLVTHCLDNGRGEQNVLKEFLTYQVYEKLTDKCFRTQLVRVRYLDEKGKSQFYSYGILIEDEKEMAKRMKCVVRDDRYGITKDSLDLQEIYIHDLFQYMIANTDWSLVMNRNLKLLCYKDESAYFTVPYDFDFSGLVNAPYAIPNPDYQQRNIRDRIYLGVAESMEELEPSIQRFKAARKEITNMIKSFKPMTSFNRRDMIKFLDSFYESLENGSFEAQVTKK